MDQKQLLIVDDDKDFIDVLSLSLSKEYQSVITASLVEVAIAELDLQKFDCIILDINLAGRNGAEVIKYLVENPTNQNNQTPLIIMSGYVDLKFIEKNKTRFAGIIKKPFEKNELKEILNTVFSETQPDLSVDLSKEELAPIKCDLPFPVNQLQSRVDNILNQVKKTTKLKQLLLSAVDRSSDNYIMAHIGLTINISTAIALKLEWNTDKTLEKFVFAAYLHDMALKSRPDLAKYRSLDNLELIKDKFTSEDFDLLWRHSEIAAKTIEGYKEIPAEVESIVRQHHELPKGNGFPNKHDFKKIIPLSAVFIIAHELADYIIRNPNWKLEKFIEEYRKKMTGAHFHKIMRALEELG